MSIDQEAKDVELSIEFAGVGLYVIHRKEKWVPGTIAPQERVLGVTVLMPTCLSTPGGPGKAKHEDGTDAVRHVPYLLMDLANLTAFDKLIPSLVDVLADDVRKDLTTRIGDVLGSIIPIGSAGDGPLFGVVRRLSREELFFEPDGPKDGINLVPSPLPLPDLSFLKRGITLKGGLLDGIPTGRPELNVRVKLNNGAFVATTLGGGRPPTQNDNWNNQVADWAGSIKWTRTIKMVPENDFLTIRIHSWDKETDTRLRLRPVTRGNKEVIELKVAILCENNPLEWTEFEPSSKKQKRDIDFKWLFSLFDPEKGKGNTVREALGGGDLPCPILNFGGPRTAGSSGCTGGQFGLP